MTVRFWLILNIIFNPIISHLLLKIFIIKLKGCKKSIRRKKYVDAKKWKW